MEKHPEGQDEVNTEDVIQKWEMTPQEARTLKLCALWAKLSYQVLPDYNHYRIPTKGDPRKSHLFRVCWKLLRETKNMLKDEEYPLYVRSQLEMMRNLRRANIDVRIDPMIMVGDKAWVRWKMWKRLYDKTDRNHQIAGAEQVHASTFRITQDLERTKDFLIRQFGDYPTVDQISAAKESGDLRHWLALQKVSPFYILLSPYCRRTFEGVKGIVEHFPSIDFAIYRPDCTKEVLQIASRIFVNEFSR